jgi:hypothetical protein
MSNATVYNGRIIIEFEFKYKGETYFVDQFRNIISFQNNEKLQELLNHYCNLYSSPFDDGVYHFAKALNVKLIKVNEDNNRIY